MRVGIGTDVHPIEPGRPCFVAGLLDGPTPLGGLINRVTALLNRILGALGPLRA